MKAHVKNGGCALSAVFRKNVWTRAHNYGYKLSALL